MSLDRGAFVQFVSQQIEQFHATRLANLQKINLRDVLRKKNPYLFRAKNILKASELITAMLEARLSSSEEKIFGDFLERLVLYVAGQTCGGRKSSARGIDLEFETAGTLYLVSVKSGWNWGNSSQYQSLEQNFKAAVRVQRQTRSAPIQSVLGMCYGHHAAVDTGFYLKLCGQRFWHFVSGDPRLYVDLIEPIGHEARSHNDRFAADRAALENRLMQTFIAEFCFADGRIDWERLVRFNSGNMPE
ncbi:MAG: cytosolic protein [Anaerolineae bacterium]|nr:cytosolic protein [Anaerolineae bacterium]